MHLSLEYYELGRQRGAGPLGALHEGVERQSGRRVVLRRLPAGQSTQTLEALQTLRAALATFDSAVVGINECGEVQDGSLLIVSPWIDGRCLRDELKQLAGQPFSEAMELARQLATVLAQAHAAGIFHLALRPSQILLPASAKLSSEAKLHLLGLGLAQALGQSYASADGPVQHPYAATEQEVRRGHPQRPLDGRTDVFALGVILWEAFSGITPLSQTLGPQGGTSSPQIMTAQQLPVGLVSLLQRMIEPEPALRPSMQEVANELSDPGAAMFAATMASGNPGPAGVVHVSVTGVSGAIRSWDRYEILTLLGRGGMGAVYKARDRRLGREVALKFILGDDPQMIGRFMQEARAQARLDHDNICKVYETGEVEGKPYIAMQLVDGISLDKASRAMSVNEKAQLIHDAAKALHTAHELGIIHRDIKPSNIMVERETTADGSLRYRPIVMDFGLARESNAAKGLTETGAVMGTPHYMAPEQARGDSRKVDRRSDVYSLGATLYELLTGEPPFSADTVFNILQQVLNQSLRPPRSHNPAIPAALDTIVCKSLNKERSQRYQTALALAEDLGRFLSAQRITAKRLSYLYRIGYWARHKPAIATLTAALFFSALGLIGYGIQTRIESARKKREAEREAELARYLGQTIKDLEWRMRTDYLLPLHNTEEEKTLVREQMAQIDRELRTTGGHGVRLAHYALGRGHLSLHEWAPAQQHLQEAERLGLVDQELDYALGRVLGERYSIALEEARKSGDKTFLEKRKKELEQEFLGPARKHLERSRALKTVAPSYVEALVDFYHQRYDSALINAQFAQKQQRNLYEATKLEGDVYMARALELKDRGEYDVATRTFREAILRYERATEIGRSDYRLHEASAEAYIRMEEIAQVNGRDPEPHMRLALEAADRALECGPRDSTGWTKKAYAYSFAALAAQYRGETEKAKTFYRSQIAAGKAAIAEHPNDAYAFEMLGVAHEMLAILSLDAGNPHVEEDLDLAVKYLSQAITINKSFTWAYNDLARTLSERTRTMAKTDPKLGDDVHRAIEFLNVSLKIDDHQSTAEDGLVRSYMLLASWQIERGGDPSEQLTKADEHAKKALALNPHLFAVHGNIGRMHTELARYALDRGQDGRAAAKQAIAHYEELIRINDKSGLAYSELCNANGWLARHELLQGQPATSALAAGHQAISRCYALDPSSLDCQMQEARLYAVEATWLGRSAPAKATPAIEQALTGIEKLLAKCPNDIDCLLPFAEISLQALGQDGSRRAPTLSAGLVATETILKQSPGWPRVMALQAALLWTGLDVVQTESERKERSLRANALFEKALAGNPLLGNLYGELAKAARAGAQR